MIGNSTGEIHIVPSKDAGGQEELFPKKEDGHSSLTVNHTVPTAQGQDPHAVILKIPESKRAVRDHLHFRVESWLYPIVGGCAFIRPG